MKTKYMFLNVMAVAAIFMTPSSLAKPEIILDQFGPEIFPKVWLESPVHAEAEVLPKSDVRECTKTIRAAMAKYPVRILNDHMEKVYVLGKLRYRGVTAGGTNSRNSIYVVRNDKISPKLLENNFHAEFSSILLRNKPEALDSKVWEKINPEGFAYGSGGVQAIQDGQSSLRLDKKLNEEGFLHQYGKASLQEDFNSYAARLFTGNGDLWEAILRHPKVKQKADLTIAFYGKIDPKFTEEYFKSLR